MPNNILDLVLVFATLAIVYQVFKRYRSGSYRFTGKQFKRLLDFNDHYYRFRLWLMSSTSNPAYEKETDHDPEGRMPHDRRSKLSQNIHNIDSELYRDLRKKYTTWRPNKDDDDYKLN